MKIVSLSLELLRVPFRVSFRHASAERSVTQGVFVMAGSDDGLIGYGEGCPRDYVTGESDASVGLFFERHRATLIACITDQVTLEQWQQRHAKEIDANPAAWCALELALLDLLSRQQTQSIEAFLDIPPLAGPFVYTAVLGAMGTEQFTGTLERYQRLGLRDYKIKLSGDAGRDHKNLAILQSAGVASAHVRADANNLWSDRNVAQSYLEALDYPFAAIEEPLRPGQFTDLVTLSVALDTRIVLDESITRVDQLTQLPEPAARWIVNLRVSKMGGLLRSLAVVNHCRDKSLALVVGAQVGETSLLTRAALTVAQTARDIMIGQEGAFSNRLLACDPMQPALLFGAQGRLEFDALQFGQCAGWGMTPTPDITHYFLKNEERKPVQDY